MAGIPEKGKFSTSIGQDVIEEALKAVKKRTDSGPGENAPVDLSLEGEAPAEAAEPQSPAPAPAVDPVQKELEELKIQLEFSQSKGRELMEKIKETHEKMLRAVADLENYKKRAQKEKEEIQKFGVERLLKDLLAIPDNLDRALEHARTSTDFDSLKKGLQMTRKLFEDTLGKHGVKSFSAVGQPFDPRLHEAMQHVETAAVPAGHVAQEVMRGYTLHDRLVRPALVMVAKAAAAPPPPSTPAEPEPS
jgi:molecular chaperone GrpE